MREADLAVLKASLTVPGASRETTAARDVDTLRGLVDEVMSADRYKEQRRAGRGGQRPVMDDLVPDQDVLESFKEYLRCDGAPDHRLP